MKCSKDVTQEPPRAHRLRLGLGGTSPRCVSFARARTDGDLLGPRQLSPPPDHSLGFPGFVLHSFFVFGLAKYFEKKCAVYALRCISVINSYFSKSGGT